MDPTKDRALQAAVKAQRILTVFQQAVGTRADHGKVGFEPGPARQFLVFPKSLRAFAGRAVVGIKYDLLESPEVPKSQRASLPRSPKKPKAKPSAVGKVVAFKPAPVEDDDDEGIAELKKQVRHAMAVLEEGKAVAAFNLLKRIVGD